ncbi:MAG: MBL fold metallo-hydrolase [Polyangiaceae bacterium]|nr:MBL fold metallo-hydrolase [Polyangiaceae bacterium]
MKVHHLNCATMCPHGGRLLSGTGSLRTQAKLICHCLLIETSEGLVLVDSGLGTADVSSPERTVGRHFLLFARPGRDPAETALSQVERLGFSRDDVRHIVLTHCDLDHAGGLPDFPKATVHVHADERDATLHPRTRLERTRYVKAHFAHEPKWAVYRPKGEPWFGFDCVRDLTGLPPEILLIPLHGHTRGHSGVAVHTRSGWLLHAGDAYFHRLEMAPDRRRCPPLLDAFQRIVEIDGQARMKNQARLRRLVRESSDEVRVFSAHDPVELERCRERAAEAGE